MEAPAKLSSTIVIGLVTLILTLLAYFYVFQENESEWKFDQRDTVSKVESKVDVLDSEVKNMQRTIDKNCVMIEELRTNTVDMYSQFTRMTEILSRLDKRTERLENYFFDLHDKGDE